MGCDVSKLFKGTNKIVGQRNFLIYFGGIEYMVHTEKTGGLIDYYQQWLCGRGGLEDSKSKYYEQQFASCGIYPCN